MPLSVYINETFRLSSYTDMMMYR